MALLDDVVSGGGPTLFVLGPPGSGRRSLLVGLFKTARTDGRDLVHDVSDDLRRLALTDDTASDDEPPEATTEPPWHLRLQLTGGVLSGGTTVVTTDHDQTELESLADALPADPGTVDEEGLRELKRHVESADGLVYVLDCARVAADHPLDTATYTDVLGAVPDKRALVVAARAAVYAEPFHDQRGHTPEVYFEEFTEFVDSRLRQAPTAKALLQTTGETAHPVARGGPTDSRDGPQPRRGSGREAAIGFDELIDRLR